MAIWRAGERRFGEPAEQQVGGGLRRVRADPRSTLVSDGFASSASSVLSMPTTATSSGTERPVRCSTLIAATASRSLAHMIASGLAWARSSSAAGEPGVVREVVGRRPACSALVGQPEPVDRVEVAGETSGAGHGVDRAVDERDAAAALRMEVVEREPDAGGRVGADVVERHPGRQRADDGDRDAAGAELVGAARR